MEQVKNVLVSINLEGHKLDVGELVLDNRTIYFRYHASFIQSGLDISPIKLPFSSDITNAPALPFEGLFGVFNDSLPDGWGRLLLDRSLISKGVNINELTPLDRLTYVADKGMGALCYEPKFNGKEDTSIRLDLDVIAQEMDHVLKGASSDIIDELFTMGGSSGGARPKIQVIYNEKRDELTIDSSELIDGFDHWLIKFPSSSDHIEIANIEYAYHKMALKAGLEMSECKLFMGKQGKAYFGTKRFDRVGGKRIHMHTASGLMHDNFRVSTMDYGHLMDCAFKLEKHVKAYEKVLRIAAFNVFSHNRDDHSKNFSFLMDANGVWKLAPAYDLTFSNSAYGLHSTMIAGESKNPTSTHLIKLALQFGVKNPEKIIEQVKEAISQWRTIAKGYGVSEKVSSEIEKVLNSVNK